MFVGKDWTELSLHFGIIGEEYNGENDEQILIKTKKFFESIILTNREKEIADDIRQFLNMLYQNTDGYKESSSIWKSMMEMEHHFNLIKYTIKLLDCMST
ncbi:hypothetical protein [Paenibacillus alba]|uniref:CdiI immunity protein domain-containing protein n=1 Tax=Paenibacillus alba TaxID=1197127 RepID=A0ABU6GDE3_9BACL|nr:hypothetical protein [Paenibacillus alba]MEC0231931.1 hypothetical protein [Paenibacillus alba]